MTRGRLAGTAGRLTGDTTLRQFRLTGGRPRVTFYNQPAPLVAESFRRRSNMVISRSPRGLALLGAMALLAALPMPAAHAARSQITLSSGSNQATLEADEIDGTLSGGAHAVGKVVLTGTHGVLYADRVDATQSKSTAGASPSAVQEARATGHVRVTSQPKPDERMEATGT